MRKAVRSGINLARWWAAEKVRADAPGAAGKIQLSIELAARYQLVTAYSGAVVLETADSIPEARTGTGGRRRGTRTCLQVPEPSVPMLLVPAGLVCAVAQADAPERLTRAEPELAGRCAPAAKQERTTGARAKKDGSGLRNGRTGREHEEGRVALGGLCRPSRPSCRLSPWWCRPRCGWKVAGGGPERRQFGSRDAERCRTFAGTHVERRGR